MSFTVVMPAPALRPYIARYWSLRARFDRPERITLLPDAGAHLTIGFDEPVRSRRFPTPFAPGRLHVVGAMLRSDEQVLLGNQHVIGVSFKPAGFPRFHRRDAMHKATERVEPFEGALPLNGGGSLAELAPALDRHFLERLAPPRTNVLEVVRDIEACGGNIRVDALIRRHATTGRSLERHFEQEIGVTPQEFIELTRFKRALTLVESELGRRSLTELAWDCGYYDNAHLTRAFKRFTGEAPSRFTLSDLSKSASA